MRFLTTLFILLFVLGLQAQPVPVLIKDIWPGDTSSTGATVFVSSFPLGNLLYFRVDDGTHGMELWKTDGTVDGTVMVKDINPSATTPGVEKLLFGNDGYVYFTGNAGTRRLWRSDGTDAGTKEFDEALGVDFGFPSVDPHTSDFLQINGLLYFRASLNNPANDLWVSDGTSAGTSIVKTFQSSLTSFALTAFQNKIFFRARDAQAGTEFWVTDGTEAGTVKVKDIFPGTISSELSDFRVAGGKLFFHAKTPDYGREMWVSDGTESGTVLLKDIRPGTQDGIRATNWMRDAFVLADGRIMFEANNNTNSYELWISDGTPEGTNLLKDINTGNLSSELAFLNTEGNKALFRATTSATGNELWVSNGTLAGTYMVKDIRPSGSSLSINYVQHGTHNELLYFTANDGVTGGELWVTDGTLSGTKLVYDIIPGMAESFPSEIYSLGDKLVFFAITPATGRELWALDFTVSAAEPARTWGAELYPTVSADGLYTLQITDEHPQTYHCELYDLSGRLHRQFTTTSGTQPMTLQGLPAGGYWVRLLSQDGKSCVVKMVVVGK